VLAGRLASTSGSVSVGGRVAELAQDVMLPDSARRVGDVYAVAVAQGPDPMLLDEPTNHLSPGLAGEIEEAMGRSPGAVVVASHDRWLRRRWPGAVRDLG
jgi:macrolide transport system ATP-binding/permease protein